MHARVVAPLGVTLLLAGVARAADAPSAGAVGSCAGVTEVMVSAARTLIPIANAPDGTCTIPGAVLPIEIVAQVFDGGSNGVAGCSVLFWFDFGPITSCGLAFGELCDGGVAVTDALGQARIHLTMRQEDIDFCNCLPSACDPSLCPLAWGCAPRCTVSEDKSCQVAISAAAGTVQSTNHVLIEYER